MQGLYLLRMQIKALVDTVLCLFGKEKSLEIGIMPLTKLLNESEPGQKKPKVLVDFFFNSYAPISVYQ